MKKLTFLFLLAIFIILPTSVSAQTASNSTIADLLGRIETLQNQLAIFQGVQSQFGFATCVNLTRNLERGSTDANTAGEVSQLRNFLLSRGHFTTGNSDPVGTFGVQTELAVQNFQAQNGIVSSGSPWSTGYGKVGPLTRSKIQQLSCGSGALASATPTPTPAGATFTLQTPYDAYGDPDIPGGSYRFVRWTLGSGVNLVPGATMSVRIYSRTPSEVQILGETSASSGRLLALFPRDLDCPRLVASDSSYSGCVLEATLINGNQIIKQEARVQVVDANKIVLLSPSDSVTWTRGSTQNVEFSIDCCRAPDDKFQLCLASLSFQDCLHEFTLPATNQLSSTITVGNTVPLGTWRLKLTLLDKDGFKLSEGYSRSTVLVTEAGAVDPTTTRAVTPTGPTRNTAIKARLAGTNVGLQGATVEIKYHNTTIHTLTTDNTGDTGYLPLVIDQPYTISISKPNYGHAPVTLNVPPGFGVYVFGVDMNMSPSPSPTPIPPNPNPNNVVRRPVSFVVNQAGTITKIPGVTVYGYDSLSGDFVYYGYTNTSGTTGSAVSLEVGKSYEFSFSKTGYQSQSITLTLPAGTTAYSYTVALTPGSSPAPTPPTPPNPSSGHTITVTKAGSGTGTVNSAPSGINCGSDCSGSSGSFSTGSTVTLGAGAGSGSTFTGWSGACTGTQNTCTFYNLNGAKQAVATFSLSSVVVPPTPVESNIFNLTVLKSGDGSGTVTGSNINCGNTCSYSTYAGTTITLSANPASGSTFTGWGDDCEGNSTCQVTLGPNRRVTAYFASTANTPAAGSVQPLTVTAPAEGASLQVGQSFNISWSVSCHPFCREEYKTFQLIDEDGNNVGASWQENNYTSVLGTVPNVPAGQYRYRVSQTYNGVTYQGESGLFSIAP